MRTTLDIEAPVLEAARAIAAQRGTSLGAVISSLARKGLQAGGKQEGRSLPVFSVPADAPPLNLEKVRELIEDEGLSS